MKSKSGAILLIICIVLLIISRVIKYYKSHSHFVSNTTIGASSKNQGQFNRNSDHLIYTKHARCRMACRDITEGEIKEILHDGDINYSKSEMNDRRGPRYALEGYSNEHQHLRIIFAPEDDGMVVVTCIDLDKEWQCNCN